MRLPVPQRVSQRPALPRSMGVFRACEPGTCPNRFVENWSRSASIAACVAGPYLDAVQSTGLWVHGLPAFRVIDRGSPYCSSFQAGRSRAARVGRMRELSVCVVRPQT